ncbi:hypothetical protein [Natronobacterium texcoconense]|uniref:DUF8060 domain-containing protein n=1 Tax=Natronobacterium texcoconense TaxID=1095778 RepID=A0A1H1ICP8_NATTX|nr:hypothetical protein [Natronobacterium texcoconense]SDR35473.1 hypothetical protein SAMN04489842_3437 [Natronobacterium texcoconense]
MTDTTPPAETTESTTESFTDAEQLPDEPPEPIDEDGGVALEPTRVRRYLAWGGLAVCSLLALVATVQFYGSVTSAIDLWVADRYQPLMQAAFNLVVLLGSLVGISLVVRELS